ncbi:MAG: hypothetical protein ABIE14_00620 [Patescibacteria group bacterium]
MLKNKNKKIRSTADLIVRHAERHLVKRPHLRLLAQFSRFTGTAIFVFAGVCVMLAAFYVVNSADMNPAFTAENTTDYAAQKTFYAGEEPLHAASNEFTRAQINVREAAIAAELSRALNVIGFALIALALWYLHQKHGIFNHNRAGFVIRKIR